MKTRVFLKYFVRACSKRIKVFEYLKIKLTHYQMALFFCKRRTPPLRIKSNGVMILKGNYFTFMVQQILALSQLLFLVQNL